MLRKLEYVCICLAFLLALFLASNADENVPISKLSQNGAATLKFFYCYSCGYRKMFDEYVNIIQNKYPDITIDGRNYDPPGMNMFMSRTIGIVKMLAIFAILAGVNIFNYFGQPEPSWWTWCTENKVYACMMIFFLCNIVEGHLISSGAFEISLNDVPVWSKLETGRIPQPSELFQIIDSHMQFTAPVKHNYAK